jgi:hypothetical protein
VPQNPRKRLCSPPRKRRIDPPSGQSRGWIATVQPLFRRWGLPPSPNPGVGLHASPNPRQRASPHGLQFRSRWPSRSAPPFQTMERIRVSSFQIGDSRTAANSRRPCAPARAGEAIRGLDDSRQPTPSPARYTGRIEDAGDRALRNQTRHKPRQSRILARHGAFRLLTGDQGCARTIPHRFRPGIVSAQFPHSRTIPHTFFCRLLPIDAK